MNDFFEDEFGSSDTSELKASRRTEASCLGSMLLSERACDEVLVLLTEECFYFPSFRLVFRHIREMRLAGMDLDYETLRDHLQQAGELATIGGEDAILELAEIVPSPANSATYAQQVRLWWVRRQVEALGLRAFDPDTTVDELKLEAERIILGASTTQLPRSGPLYKFPSENAVKSISSGFQVVDGHGCGGWPTGQMSLVMAGSNVGKSAQMIRMAVEAARLEGFVLYATFADLNASQIHSRVMKQLCGWDRRPRELHLQHVYDDALAEMRKLRIIIYDATELRSGRNVETFLAWLSAQKREFASVFVDYAQELRTSKKVRTDLGVAEECSDALTWWAHRNADTAVVVGSQITVGNKREGTQDMPKGGRVWWERAGIVLKISRIDDPAEVPPEYRSVTGVAVAHCEKNRFGPLRPKNWWRFDETRGCYEEL